MVKHIVDERTGIPYTLVDDYYFPWGELPDNKPEHRPIGIWGQRHLRHIKQHRRSLYTEFLTTGKLCDYLADLNNEAEEMFSQLVKQLTEKEGVTEQLKVDDQMQWVEQMNNIRNRATGIVNVELIHF